MQRAAELTPNPFRCGRRLLRAAELAVEVGQLDRARRLLGEIDPDNCEALDRARMGLVRDMIEPGAIANPESLDSLVDAATEASSVGEIDIALRLLEAAAMHSGWADPGPQARNRIIAAARRVPAPEGDLRVISILGICDPVGSGAMLSEVAARTTPDTCHPKIACLLGTALHVTGAFDRSATFLGAAASGLREQGWVWLLPQALVRQAWNGIFAGGWDLAMAAGEQAASLARDTHQPLWEAAAQAARSVVAAIRGDNGTAESLLGEAEAIALPMGASAVLCDVQLARALVALGGGRYEEAFQHLQRTFDPHDPAHHHIRSAWRIGEYVEAAMHAGHVDQVREQLDQSEALARLSPSPRLQVGLLYARALIADNDTAQAEFQTALRATRTRWPFYRARLLLEYGTWLRRRRRIAEARVPLRAAHEAFVALGAVPWAERARQELRAARETHLNKRGAWDQLTGQEHQVAHLAAQGLSNKEIAQRLYLSPRTVGTHLYRIFPKLGVTSRTQLPAAYENCRPTAAAS
jgi:DNA-binding CsgD family transcriptional regulator/Tfp pilus assembly protein PilF